MATLAQSSQDEFTVNRVFSCYRKIGGLDGIPMIKPHLDNPDPVVAGFALWSLCWLGQSLCLKGFMLEAIDNGFARDPKRDIGKSALLSAGHFLRAQRDRDFAQMLIRWAPPEQSDDLLDRPLPRGMSLTDFHACVDTAGQAMGDAMGADPAKLVDDDGLEAACVKRFIAERQDG